MRLLFLLVLPVASGSTPFQTRELLKTAIGEYMADAIFAENKYGPIAAWDVSVITDMHVRRRSA